SCAGAERGARASELRRRGCAVPGGAARALRDRSAGDRGGERSPARAGARAMSPSPRAPRIAPVGYADVPDFHVAAARRRSPELEGVPVVIGGDPAKRGRVIGLTPELRALGIEEGMEVAEALQRAPAARWLRTDMTRVRELSGQLRAT